MFPLSFAFFLGTSSDAYYAFFYSTLWTFLSFRRIFSVPNLTYLIIFYRFKCIDLDGNGVITPNEMQFFYEEQHHRMECMALEPVLFEDILCQIVDMIAPEVKILILAELRIIFFNLLFRHDFTVIDTFCLQREDYITLRDLKGCKLSGNVFNILFNLNKFMAFESRDPFLIRQVHSTFN